jgi:hypothetical protein
MDAALTRLVWTRANGCCEYCQMPQAADDARFEIDHIVARKHVGPTVASNLCLSCFYWGFSAYPREKVQLGGFRGFQALIVC